MKKKMAYQTINFKNKPQAWWSLKFPELFYNHEGLGTADKINVKFDFISYRKVSRR